MKEMDYNIINILPTLDSTDKQEVIRWYEDVDAILKVAKITDPEVIYQLAYLSSHGEARKAIKEIKEISRSFPSLAQLRKGLLGRKKLSKIELYDHLKNITIKRDEELEDFNNNYLQMYQQIDAKFKEGITVMDYLKSIRYRREACRVVLLDDCSTIEEATKSAEKAQKLWEFENSLEEETRRTFTKGYKARTRSQTFYSNNFENGEEKKIVTRKYNLSSDYEGPKREFGEKGIYYNKNPNVREKSFYQDYYNKNSREIQKEIPILKTASIICYRCQEPGHKVYQCPYSNEELIQVLSNRIKKNMESSSMQDKKN